LAEKHEKPANEGGGAPVKPGIVPALATYLSNKSATTDQTKKFLATAGWLHQKGSKTMTTGDVTKALKDNNQSRLSNASQCLNNNVGKGFCEKADGSFFITPEGLKSLGIS